MHYIGHFPMKRDSHNPEILQCQVSGLFNPKEAYIFSSLKHYTCCKTRYMLHQFFLRVLTFGKAADALHH